MKSIIIVALILISLSSKSIGQTVVVGINGDAVKIDTPKVVINHAPLITIAGLKGDSALARPDSSQYLHYYLRYNPANLKVTSQGLDLVNVQPMPVPKIPVPRADIQQSVYATKNQKVLQFRNLPCSADDLMLFRNTSKRPQKEFTIDCVNNTITMAAPQASGDYIEIVFLVRER